MKSQNCLSWPYSRNKNIMEQTWMPTFSKAKLSFPTAKSFMEQYRTVKYTNSTIRLKILFDPYSLFMLLSNFFARLQLDELSPYFANSSFLKNMLSWITYECCIWIIFERNKILNECCIIHSTVVCLAATQPAALLFKLTSKQPLRKWCTCETI